jgi:hypothetical protein
MNQEQSTWGQHWDAFTRRHPIFYFVVVLILALLSGPLMIAATRMTAVLYKDF